MCVESRGHPNNEKQLGHPGHPPQIWRQLFAPNLNPLPFMDHVGAPCSSILGWFGVGFSMLFISRHCIYHETVFHIFQSALHKSIFCSFLEGNEIENGEGCFPYFIFLHLINPRKWLLFFFLCILHVLETFFWLMSRDGVILHCKLSLPHNREQTEISRKKNLTKILQVLQSSDIVQLLNYQQTSRQVPKIKKYINDEMLV